MERFLELHGGAFRQEFNRFRRQRGRAGQRVSRHRQTADDAYGQMSRGTLPQMKRLVAACLAAVLCMGLSVPALALGEAVTFL